jgi:hypothetical protein
MCGTQDKETIHEAMNYQANMSRYAPTPPPDFVAVEEALGVIRDALTVHLDKVWKLALTDDTTVPRSLPSPPRRLRSFLELASLFLSFFLSLSPVFFLLLTSLISFSLFQGTMLRHFLSVGLCQMYSAVGRT